MEFERPVGSCFVAETEKGEKIPCRVVWLKKSIHKATCENCLFETGVYDGRGGGCCAEVNSVGNCVVNRVFHEKVCFIDPDKFDPEIHGVTAWDDPYYLPEDLTQEKVKKILGYREEYWREYVKYWAEHGKKFEFRGHLDDGDITKAPPLSEK